MQSKATTRLAGVEMIDGTGHWMQQEQPGEVGQRLLAFIDKAGGAEQALKRDLSGLC